ncbi:hypothetical protein AB0C52_04925 [Streptomyces sp. NPDC048717]|uniref:hypothetical protein n=1 Tax=Streptomyces sp. NPDC048717 TaxID=3154928 RepID=UPI00341E9110
MRSDLRASSASRAPRVSRVSRTSVIAAVTVLALAAGTAQALADDPATPSPVGVGRATTDTFQRGNFTVNAWTDAPQATVTKVSAKIRKGDTVVTEIAQLSPVAYNPGRFQAPTVLKLAEDGGTIQDLGKYAIDVTATDSLGNTVTRTDAGTLDFTLTPQLDFGLSTPKWNDRTSRPTGTLVGAQPGSGDLVPITGRGISVLRLGVADEAARTVATDDLGIFSGEPYTDVKVGEEFRVSYNEDSEQVHGSFDFVKSIYSLVPRSIKATATADRTRVLPGQQVTVTGTLNDPNAPATPAEGTPQVDTSLAGQQVRVGFGSFGREDGRVTRTVTTDANGRFTAKLPFVPGLNLDSWVVTPVDPYLSFPKVTGKLAIPQEGRITLETVALAADGTGTLTGTFRSWYNPWNAQWQTGGQKLVLEHSADGRTGWRTLASGTSKTYPGFYALSGKGFSGYYRVRHPLSDQFLDSSTAIWRMSRNATRILNVNAAPEPVRKGKTVTVTGKLQHQVGTTWKTYGNAPVTVWFKAKGSKTWTKLGSAKTNSSGVATYKKAATVSGWYTMRHSGDGSHFNSANAYEDYVEVR